MEQEQENIMQELNIQNIQKLNTAKDEGEDVFLETLADCAKEIGIKKISQETKLNRENLYRSLKAGTKPRYGTIRKILSACGVDITLVHKTKNNLSPKP